MKAKNLNASLLVFLGLLFLSFSFFVLANEDVRSGNNILLDSDQDGLTDSEEKAYGTDKNEADTDQDGYSDGAEVKSGYDPLKPAPGDKIEPVSLSNYRQGNASSQNQEEKEEKNLTREMAEKISLLATENSEDQSVKIEDIQSMVESVVFGQGEEMDFPEISEDEINVKKQNFKNLSEEEIKEKKAEDFSDYAIAVYYILATNSPKPITSASDLSKVMLDFSTEIISAVTTRNTEEVNSLAKNGEKMLGQLKEVEVPESELDIHIKAISIAQYASGLKDNLKPNYEDPLRDIANLSQIQGFMGVASEFFSEISTKFIEYDIDYDEEIKEKIKDSGLIAPDPEDLPMDLIESLTKNSLQTE